MLTGLAMHFILYILLAAIVLSLIEAMYYLARDSGEKDRTRVVRALTVRIGLSLLLFVAVVIGNLFGQL